MDRYLLCCFLLTADVSDLFDLFSATDIGYPTPKRPSTDTAKATIATPASGKPSLTPTGAAQKSPRLQAATPGSVNTVFKARANVSYTYEATIHTSKNNPLSHTSTSNLSFNK